MTTAQRSHLGLLTPLLAQLGFEKHADGIFTIDIGPGVIGWLGLNRSTQHRVPGEVELNPVVGVRFQDVERLVADCRGEKLHPYVPPTISISLGYLLPDSSYKGWVFGPEGSADVAAELVDTIGTYALPYMHSVANIQELNRRAELLPGFEHQLAYRRPVIALLAGEVEQAQKLLDESIANLGTRSDSAAAEFKRFTEKLRHRLGR